MSEIKQLFQAALEAYSKAYAPYSKFLVGAAIEGENGQIYRGCNVENVSYPCGTCAEAGAVAAMNVGGCKKIKQIVVVADSQNLIVPCGACLQRLAEFSDSKTKIHLANLQGIQKTLTFNQIMPVKFCEESLKNDK